MEIKFKIERISEKVCDHFHIEKKDLIGKERKKNICSARHIFFYIAVNHSKLRRKKICDYAKKYHSALIHSLQLVESEMQFYPEVRQNIDSILKNLYQLDYLIIDDVDLLKITMTN